MSDLYVNTGYKETQLAPFGPIGIIAHTSNKEFVKEAKEYMLNKESPDLILVTGSLYLASEYRNMSTEE